MYLLFSQFFNSNSLQGRSRPTFYHQFFLSSIFGCLTIFVLWTFCGGLLQAQMARPTRPNCHLGLKEVSHKHVYKTKIAGHPNIVNFHKIVKSSRRNPRERGNPCRSYFRFKWFFHSTDIMLRGLRIDQPFFDLLLFSRIFRCICSKKLGLHGCPGSRHLNSILQIYNFRE